MQKIINQVIGFPEIGEQFHEVIFVNSPASGGNRSARNRMSRSQYIRHSCDKKRQGQNQPNLALYLFAYQ
ncbi:MAG: hypothetical protein RL212_1312 [Pseudomonadota bacterium]